MIVGAESDCEDQVPQSPQHAQTAFKVPPSEALDILQEDHWRRVSLQVECSTSKGSTGFPAFQFNAISMLLAVDIVKTDVGARGATAENNSPQYRSHDGIVLSILMWCVHNGPSFAQLVYVSEDELSIHDLHHEARWQRSIVTRPQMVHLNRRVQRKHLVA